MEGKTKRRKSAKIALKEYMQNTVTVALISGGASIIVGALALAGVLISSSKTNKSIQSRLELSQAVMDTKIEALTREVRTHNNFALRVPVIEEQIRVQNHRIKDLEVYHR